MAENLFETHYDVTKKSKIKRFYEANRILIFIVIFIFLFSLASIGLYLKNRENKIILLSNNYIEAKVLLENGKKEEATNVLKNIILANNSSYSTLSLFLILNGSLITDEVELTGLFNHILENNKFNKEIKNLIIYKKALFQSSFINESELLEVIKPLVNTETVWKPHALLLLGDYFFAKKEFIKAKEFYTQILYLKNLHEELYKYVKLQLGMINNG
jgi:predicted negative regulator of RcsB-dependent stress response